MRRDRPKFSQPFFARHPLRQRIGPRLPRWSGPRSLGPAARPFTARTSKDSADVRSFIFPRVSERERSLREHLAEALDIRERFVHVRCEERE